MLEYLHKKGFLHKCAITFGNQSVTMKAIEQIANECTLAVEPRELEEVTHGEWIRQNLYKHDPLWFCSECRTLGSPAWKRCPVCEAKMDGERKEQG